jgi:hypothetical protein
MESYLQFMNELSLPPRERDMMLHENAAALFKIDSQPGKMGLGSFFSRI